MKFYKCLITTAGLVGMFSNSITAYADYQSEISYSASYEEQDKSGDTSSGELKYKYYLNGISGDSKGPLAEAVYLQRVSSIEGSLASSVYTTPGGDENVTNNLSLSYINMNPGTPLFWEVGYAVGNFEYKSGGATLYEGDTTRLLAVVGWFIKRTTSVDVKVENNAYAFKGDYAVLDGDDTNVYIAAKHLILSADGTAINLEGLAGKLEYDSDSNRQVKVAADYYFDKKLSVGGSFTSESGDVASAEGEWLSIRGRYFFNDKFSLSAELESFTASNASGTDSDSSNVELFYRF